MSYVILYYIFKKAATIGSSKIEIFPGFQLSTVYDLLD